MKEVILKRMRRCLSRADRHRAKKAFLEALFWVAGAVQVGILAGNLWDEGYLSDDDYNPIGKRLVSARILWEAIYEEATAGKNPALTEGEIEAFETYLEENAAL